MDNNYNQNIKSSNDDKLNLLNENNKRRYHILKTFPIECPICSGKELNLATIIKHINFSKKHKIGEGIKYSDVNDIKDYKKRLKEQLNIIRYKIRNNIDIE